MVAALPLLEEVTADEESSVRDALASNLATIVKALLSRATPEESTQVVDLVWALSEPLLKDKDQQVRAVAEEGVVEYAGMLTRELVAGSIIDNVLAMSHDEVEEHRMTAMKLLGELSFVLGPEMVKQKVSPEVIALASDHMFRVRKSAALHIGKVCRWVPKEHAVEELLPVYLTLAEDEIWGVRKACAESMSDVAAALPSQVRSTSILPLFDKLATDVSRWVRNAAFQHLGPLIATLSSEEVTPKLLEYYASMATGKGQCGAGDNEMPSFCAYNFPAVVLTVGRDNWQHLREAYNELLKDIQWKVRRTLSYSIHEIALILGPELTKEALLPALDVFLKDLDEVRVGALQNLSKLLGVLEPSCRSNYVSLICSLEMESDNWRFRQLLAQQLGELFTLFDEDVVQAELYPIFMKLSRDPVAEVRNAAGQQLQAILARLAELKVTWCDEFMEELQDLATDRVYLHRLMFAQMCENLLTASQPFDLEAFSKDFLPQLLALAEDKVANIRQKVATCLLMLKARTGLPDRHAAAISAALKSLQADQDVEVLRTMGQEIDTGMTRCRHQGLANGASRDAELRAALMSGAT